MDNTQIYFSLFSKKFFLKILVIWKRGIRQK